MVAHGVGTEWLERPYQDLNLYLAVDAYILKKADHPNLGHCSKGEAEAIAGSLDTDLRYCNMYIPKQLYGE